MRGLILAAGRGSRMGDETAALPKGMVRLRGRPLIGWQLQAMRAAGIDDIAIVRGYRAECLAVFDLVAFDNADWAETGIVASLACAEDWLRHDVTVVSYSDLVYPSAAPARLLDSPGDICITCDPNWLDLWSRRFDDPLSDAETLRLDGDRVLEIGKRASSVNAIEAQYMGLTKLTPRGAAQLLDAWRRLDAPRKDFTSMLQHLVEAGTPVNAVPYDEWWCEVDSPSDLRVAEQIVP